MVLNIIIISFDYIRVNKEYYIIVFANSMVLSENIFLHHHDLVELHNVMCSSRSGIRTASFRHRLMQECEGCTKESGISLKRSTKQNTQILYVYMYTYL